ncbi:MAG TPA: RNA polymerase sigma factor, partial [Pirellulales bacterium]
AVAVRTCLSMRRSRGRRRRYETAAGAEKSPAPQPASAALQLELARMLETLPEEDRAMVILKYAEGYSFEELASIFGLSVSACKMRVSRAREKVQRQFGPDAQP